MWLMLQQEAPDDYVIATGETNKLEDFVHTVFSSLGLDWKEHVAVNHELFRPADILISRADPERAARKLGWRAQYRMRDVAKMMVEGERKAHGVERRAEGGGQRAKDR
jgi:GDPmannose 4,6-dehydratase